MTHMFPAILPTAPVLVVRCGLGGAWEGHAASRQVRFKELYYASGWTRYIVRSAAERRLGLGTENTTFISAELRS